MILPEVSLRKNQTTVTLRFSSKGGIATKMIEESEKYMVALQITSYVNLVTKVFFALCGFAFSLASALRLRTLIKTEQLANFSGNQDVRLLGKD